MSYGVEVTTEGGQLLVLDTLLMPWLVGKATVNTVGSWNARADGYDARLVTYDVPGSGVKLLAATLPTNADPDCWYDGVCETLSPSVIMVEFRPTGSGATVAHQEIYVFDTDTPPTLSTSGYGIQIFDPAGNLVLDSGSSPISILGVATHTFGSSASTLPVSPTKPAFLLPNYRQEVYVRRGVTDVSDVSLKSGAYRINPSGQIESKFIEFTALVDTTQGLTATLTYGGSGAQAVCILEGTRYD